MNDFEYEERYGEKPMSDYEERITQERIEQRERMECLEKCIEMIKENLKKKPTTKEELQDLISEIEYEIKCLD